MSGDAVEAMLPAAAELAVSVADYDPDGVAAVLSPMTLADLHALAIALAANVDLDRPLRTEPTLRNNGDDTAAATVRLAAALFGTEPMTMLSRNQTRNVVDARAAAMYACKLLGMSSPAVGARFNRDHTTVLYAWGRVGENRRLRTAACQVAAQCGWRREQVAS